MGLFSLEHGKLAYRADFVLYGSAMVLLGAALLGAAPPGHAGWLAACSAAGLAAWSGIEYGLHRFVLHGPMPFRRWHALHHTRPTALIGTPTLLTATLFLLLAFVPALLFSDLWTACALTLGLLAGYLVYGITHHALHHWRGDSAWLRTLKRWHAMHHLAAQPCCYGVTSPFWDHVFGTAARPRDVRQRTDAAGHGPYKGAATRHPPPPESPT